MQKGIKIKILHTDCRGEYLSRSFNHFLWENSTVRWLITHDTPEYNDIVERLNCMLIMKVHAMLHDSQLPKFLWKEAVLHATYLKNCTLICVIGDTMPYKVFEGTKLNLSALVPWGCKAYIHSTGVTKLDSCTVIGYWVGFDKKSCVHCIYWLECRNVTVEHSIYFNIKYPNVITEVPLEGEHALDVGEQSTSSSEVETMKEGDEDSPKATQGEVDAPVTVALTSTHKCNLLGPDFEVSHSEGKRLRKLSAYIKCLCSGEGHISMRQSDPIVPRRFRLEAPSWSLLRRHRQMSSWSGKALRLRRWPWQQQWAMLKILNHLLKKHGDTQIGLNGMKRWKRS